MTSLSTKPRRADKAPPMRLPEFLFHSLFVFVAVLAIVSAWCA
ncbi:hypothetical protein [Devosia sp. DBB001]|nr:hypothetical protein [Devosia sp. DBB001]